MKFWKERLKFYLEKYDRLLKIFTANFILRGGVIAINLGTGILMRNVLGEANSGLFGLFIGALTLFNTALNFGFNGSALYYAKKKPEKLHLYLTTNLIVTIFSIFVIVFALFFSSFFFNFQSSLLNILFVLERLRNIIFVQARLLNFLFVLARLLNSLDVPARLFYILVVPARLINILVVI